MNSEQQIKDSGLEVKIVSRMFETCNDENKLGVYSDLSCIRISQTQNQVDKVTSGLKVRGRI